MPCPICGPRVWIYWDEGRWESYWDMNLREWTERPFYHGCYQAHFSALVAHYILVRNTRLGYDFYDAKGTKGGS